MDVYLLAYLEWDTGAIWETRWNYMRFKVYGWVMPGFDHRAVLPNLIAG